MNGSNLSDRLAISIERLADESYAVRAEFSSQKTSANIPGGSEGFNVAVDYSLPNGKSPLAFSVTNFDLLFNVTQPA